MAYDKSWTEGVYTEEDIKNIGNTLIFLINENGGEYVGKLENIGKKCGYNYKDGKLENYGGLYKAIQIAKKEYNIKSINKGRKGNLYYIDTPISKKNYGMNDNLDFEELQIIKTIIENIDFESLTEIKAIKTLKLIKKVIM